jgi:hypothetical protein
MRRRGLPTALVLAALLPAAPSRARADEFHLRDGSRFEGQVLRRFEESGRVVRLEVRTREGTRTIEVEEIRRQVPGVTAWELFEEKFAFVGEGDAEDNGRLGDWARERGLEEEARRAYLRCLAADPDHARARLALGHTRVDGRWVVPPDRARTPEDTGRAVAGEPPGPLEATLGAAFARRESERFRVESTRLDQRALGRYLDALERVRAGMLTFLGDAPPVREERTLLVLVRDDEYRRAVDHLVAPALAALPDRADAGARLRLFREGRLAPFADGRPGCCARPADENETADRAFLAHFAAHRAWSMGEDPKARTPAWLLEAAVYSVVNPMFPDDPTWCLTAGYGKPGRVPDAWRNTRSWAGIARGLASSGRALDFATLSRLDTNSLTFDALVQSWSTLQALRAKDESGTRSFLRRVRSGDEPDAALKASLRLDPAGVDRLWRDAVLR